MKKISQYIAYTILGVLIIGLVVTAILKKDFAPNIALPSYEAGDIEIIEAGVANYKVLDVEEDYYNKFVTEYNESFKLTILYSIFSGKMSREQTIIPFGTTKPELNNGYVISFDYSDDQTLKVNGKVYYETTNSDTETLYKKVIFAVEEGKGLTTINIYFYSYVNKKYYQLTTLANFDNLYKLCTELLGNEE